MQSVQFWDPLERDPVRYKPRAARGVALSELESLDSVEASEVMVKEVMAQLREVHREVAVQLRGIRLGPGDTVPDPYVTWYKDWSEDPYGGGYHAWKAGYLVPSVVQYMRRPDQGEDVFICGEAYSEQQGWVEGALCVAERLLQGQFNLKWPSWLDEDYYLGS
jgi:monoamine oxidase